MGFNTLNYVNLEMNKNDLLLYIIILILIYQIIFYLLK